MKGKVLVISVGTGTRPDSQESLAHGIAYSIKTHNPDFILFITSNDGQEKTLPIIAQLLDKEEKHDVIVLEDVDDITKIYDRLSGTFAELKQNYRRVTVDFTSGTKAITGALTILGSLFEVSSLSYVTGERDAGVVIKGTERILDIQPLSIIADKRLNEAIALFNRHQYEAVLIMIRAIEKETSSRKILDRFNELKSCARAYSAWDRFNHQDAMQHLTEVHNEIFNENKRFLNELGKIAEKEPFYIADLINNAKRRADEGKYDDAIARLYRTIVLLSQYSLKKYGYLDTENVPLNKIPDDLIHKYKLILEKVKVALDLGWHILAEKGDSAGLKYVNDNNIKDSLSKRNKSILAHGLRPLSQDDFTKFLEPVLQYTRMKISRIDQLMAFSSFCKWPE